MSNKIIALLWSTSIIVIGAAILAFAIFDTIGVIPPAIIMYITGILLFICVLMLLIITAVILIQNKKRNKK